MAERPTWVSTVGIVGIVYSGISLLGSAQDIAMPWLFAVQRRFMDQILQSIPPDPGMPDMVAIMESFMEAPSWVGSWMILSGVLGLMVNGILLYGAIKFLSLARSAPRILTIGLVSTAILRVLDLFAGIAALPSFWSFTLIGGIFGLVVSVVLLIVLQTSDRGTFQRSSDTM